MILILLDKVLKEGTYIELISFTHPVSYYPIGSPERAKRESHRWAKAPLGWIDYAFLGNGSLEPGNRISDVINARASEDGSGATYLAEQEGGRVRPDGEVLKWVISAPKPPSAGDEVGVLPFFCGDVTPRSLRVSLVHFSSQCWKLVLMTWICLGPDRATLKHRAPEYCTGRRSHQASRLALRV